LTLTSGRCSGPVRGRCRFAYDASCHECKPIHRFCPEISAAPSIRVSDYVCRQRATRVFRRWRKCAAPLRHVSRAPLSDSVSCRRRLLPCPPGTRTALPGTKDRHPDRIGHEADSRVRSIRLRRWRTDTIDGPRWTASARGIRRSASTLQLFPDPYRMRSEAVGFAGCGSADGNPSSTCFRGTAGRAQPVRVKRVP
jgi:hypothetical protein